MLFYLTLYFHLDRVGHPNPIHFIDLNLILFTSVFFYLSLFHLSASYSIFFSSSYFSTTLATIISLHTISKPSQTISCYFLYDATPRFLLVYLFLILSTLGIPHNLVFSSLLHSSSVPFSWSLPNTPIHIRFWPQCLIIIKSIFQYYNHPTC